MASLTVATKTEKLSDVTISTVIIYGKGQNDTQKALTFDGIIVGGLITIPGILETFLLMHHFAIEPLDGMRLPAAFSISFAV
jgi:hypothetical protein